MVDIGVRVAALMARYPRAPNFILTVGLLAQMDVDYQTSRARSAR